jgi:uncharacterized protein YndB with AHSA1/START domain
MGAEEDAGRLIDGAMVWSRRLDVPVERVWEAISTQEGLRQWWMPGAPNEIDLRVGGEFRHHWKSTIVGLSEGEYIDLESEPGFGRQRFEVAADGDGAIFTFREPIEDPARLDLEFYAGPAAGYHCMIDGLEMQLTGKQFELGAERDAQGRPVAGSYEADLIEFYREYLPVELERALTAS